MPAEEIGKTLVAVVIMTLLFTVVGVWCGYRRGFDDGYAAMEARHERWVAGMERAGLDCAFADAFKRAIGCGASALEDAASDLIKRKGDR